MNTIKMPFADQARSPSLDVSSTSLGTSARQVSASKATPEGARGFRDVLRAMTMSGKTDAGVTPTQETPIRALSAVRMRFDRDAMPTAKPSAEADTDAIDKVEKSDASAVVTPAVMADSAVRALASTLGIAATVAHGRQGSDRDQSPMRSDHSAQIDAVAVAVSTMPAVPARNTQAADLPGGQSPAGLHLALSTGAGVSPVAAEPSQSAIGTATEPAASTEAAAFCDAAPAKATVVAQQTHFAPAPIASAVGQIADAVMAEVPALVDQAAAPVEPGGSIPAAVVDRSPVRILTVRLDPPDLGEVTVHMRLKGESLDLRVVAADPGTAQLLNAQRDTLADLMCDSGYQADIANVQVAAADTSSAGSAGSQPGHGFDKPGSPPPGPADGRRNQAADQGGDPRAGSQGHSQTTSGRSDREDTVDRVTVRGGTVYV